MSAVITNSSKEREMSEFCRIDIGLPGLFNSADRILVCRIVGDMLA